MKTVFLTITIYSNLYKCVEAKCQNNMVTTRGSYLGKAKERGVIWLSNYNFSRLTFMYCFLASLFARLTFGEVVFRPFFSSIIPLHLWVPPSDSTQSANSDSPESPLLPVVFGLFKSPFPSLISILLKKIGLTKVWQPRFYIEPLTWNNYLWGCLIPCLIKLACLHFHMLFMEYIIFI